MPSHVVKLEAGREPRKTIGTGTVAAEAAIDGMAPTSSSATRLKGSAAPLATSWFA